MPDAGPGAASVRTLPGLPSPLRTPNAIWGLEYRGESVRGTGPRRGGIAMFPPGTDDREAARLIRHYRWVDFIGIRAFAVALPLLFVALHSSLAVSPMAAMAIGVAIDIAAFAGIALALRWRLPASGLVVFLAHDSRDRELRALALALDEARTPGIDAVRDEILWAAAWNAVRER